MLANRSESRNFNATSEVGDVTIAAFNASYNDNTRQLIFSKSIIDLVKYKANAETVEADYTEFQDGVIGEIG